MDDTLVGFGGPIKSLGTPGSVGGYLVLFTDATSPDLSGDFFTATTDFGPAEKTMVWYDHLMDKDVRYCLDAHASLKMDDKGVWVQAQLDMRNEYEQMIYGLAEQGKLGWSSGTAAHLVGREAEGKSHRITRWPLGLDASMTTIPCEPRTRVVPLKSLFQSGDKPHDGLTLDDNISKVLDAAEALAGRMSDLSDMRKSQGRRLSQSRIDSAKAIMATLQRIVDASQKPTEAEVLELRLRLARA